MTRAWHPQRGLSALVVLAACSSGGEATTPSGVPVDVSFVVEGGIAGVQERLEVAKDGALALFRNGRPAGEGRLEAADLARLQGLVASPGFRGLNRSYLPANTCCDRFQYTVSVVRPEGTQSVTTLDDMSGPRPLADVIALLQRAKALVTKPGTTGEPS
jgi:hypothetical protein